MLRAFTFGDLFSHLAGLERWMVAETVQGCSSRYAGHGMEHTGGLASGLAGVRAYLDQGHAESLAIFATVADADLQAPCTNSSVASITTST